MPAADGHRPAHPGGVDRIHLSVGIRRPDWNVGGQYAAGLSRAEVRKTFRNYAGALQIIETAPAEQTNLNKALFLKAPVLLESMDRRCEAKQCLVPLLRSEPKDTRLYQWGSRPVQGSHRSRLQRCRKA
ncbi:MAG: hypothetical protein AMJ54_04495 [Deltaproteobacteria bacterium SG8_13]|nr:MAG: hypothetical protein AMJ54_04495 [Deltaproteobacteria bacterium SG8_13]